MTKFHMNRRTLLRSGIAASAMTLTAPSVLRAAGYPERNISVYIPTREGGGADRNFRAFTCLWADERLCFIVCKIVLLTYGTKSLINEVC